MKYLNSTLLSLRLSWDWLYQAQVKVEGCGRLTASMYTV